jgi:N,N'-diacetyllegionaminate synthase
MPDFNIGNKRVSISDPVLIIAEAGVNHNGDLALALELVDQAARCGADMVKFQSFRTEEIVTAQAPKADYQISNTGSHETQFEMLKGLELSPTQHVDLQRHCEKKEILYLSTPYDKESALDIFNQGAPGIKIASTDTTNLPFLDYVAGLGLPVIMSTGMCDIAEVSDAVRTLRDGGQQQLALLHCTSEYPAPFDELNLRAIKTLEDKFECVVGFSDHTAGIQASIWGVCAGARIVEKHFTLDRSMRGPDHAASIEPAELSQLVAEIRLVERSIGDGIKRATKSEIRNKSKMQKSLVATRNIEEGELLTAACLTAKRPGSGLSPLRWKSVIGLRASRSIKANDILTEDSVIWR